MTDTMVQWHPTLAPALLSIVKDLRENGPKLLATSSILVHVGLGRHPHNPDLFDLEARGVSPSLWYQLDQRVITVTDTDLSQPEGVRRLAWLIAICELSGQKEIDILFIKGGRIFDGWFRSFIARHLVPSN